MTPIYAAPELFDGRPSIHSDQYSLAIVYQEMLTGVLPFEGRTTAQLAAQHLHSRPRLDRLPASDEAVIARALSKSPEQRFGSCREMIQELQDAAAGEQRRAPRPRRKIVPAPRRADRDRGDFARDIEGGPRGCRRAAARKRLPCGGHQDPGYGNPDARSRPAAAGIGPRGHRLAADAVYRHRRRGGAGADRIARADRGPLRRSGRTAAPCSSCLFDTDAESLRIATEAARAPLGDAATILLPLRPAADYRNDANGRFNWLSRRWIYNIPRNLQTQGLRPLGRLALVDNMERAIEKVTQALRAAADPAGIVATAAATGLPFQVSFAAGVHRFLHRRRHGERHGAGLRLYRPPGAPRVATARRRRLRPSGTLDRPQLRSRGTSPQPTPTPCWAS